MFTKSVHNSINKHVKQEEFMNSLNKHVITKSVHNQ